MCVSHYLKTILLCWCLLWTPIEVPKSFFTGWEKNRLFATLVPYPGSNSARLFPELFFLLQLLNVLHTWLQKNVIPLRTWEFLNIFRRPFHSNLSWHKFFICEWNHWNQNSFILCLNASEFYVLWDSFKKCHFNVWKV